MIGSRLVKKLIELNHDVVVIDNLWRGKIEYLKSIDGFEIKKAFYNIDLSNYQNKNKIIDVLKNSECVFHLADIVAGIGYVFSNQYEIFKINNKINSLTFEACEEANVKRIIYAGTACSFPEHLQLSVDSVLKEDMLFPAQPESAYGWSKLLGTLELNYLSLSSKIQVNTLILHNVYGPNCDISYETSQVIPSLIRKINELKENEELVVWGSGNQGRAFIYVDDVIDAFVSLLSNPRASNIIQIGPNYCTPIKELVKILVENISSKKLKIVYDKTKPEGDVGRCADYSLAEDELNWEPRTSIEKGLSVTFHWIKNILNNK